MIACSGAAYAAQPIVDHSNPDETAMTFLEYPISKALSAPAARGSLSGYCRRHCNRQGSLQVSKFLRAGANGGLWGYPGLYRLFGKANGADVPFSVGDYQEFNEAMLEVEIPAAEDVELVVEYGGFPQESRNMSEMQGSAEISDEYICLENAALAPRLMNVMPDEGMYPATIEITLPKGMTVIPFCASEAEIVTEYEDGTATWRYEDNGTGGILYAGDYICEEIEAGGITIEFYYGRKHQSVMESAGAVEAVRAVVDYCTEHYGPLSFGMGDRLKLIQSRVAGGGYAADGASLLDEADFTTANLGDTEKAPVREVMIHELVHQWWGLANMFDSSNETDPGRRRDLPSTRHTVLSKSCTVKTMPSNII